MNHLSANQIFEFIDGELSPKERAFYLAHFTACNVCSAELAVHQAITKAGKQRTTTQLDSLLTDRILNAVYSGTVPTPAPARHLIAGIPLKRILGFTVFVATLAILANLPQSNNGTMYPSHPLVQQGTSAFSDFVLRATHVLINFFTSLSVFIPIKNIHTLLLLALSFVMLMVIDRFFRKSFHIKGKY